MFSFIHVFEKPTIVRENDIGFFNRRERRNALLRSNFYVNHTQNFLLTREFVDKVDFALIKKFRK